MRSLLSPIVGLFAMVMIFSSLFVSDWTSKHWEWIFWVTFALLGGFTVILVTKIMIWVEKGR